MARGKEEAEEFEGRVITINHAIKVAKGGRRFRLTASVVAGDKSSYVGFSTSKTQEVPETIKGAVEVAKEDLATASCVGGATLRTITGRYGPDSVLMKPAVPDTGVIASEPARVVLELAGITDILSRPLGSNTLINMVCATISGLQNLKNAKDVTKLHGKSIKELYN